MKSGKKEQACPICSVNLQDAAAKTIPYPMKGLEKTGIEPEYIIFCDNCGAGIAVPACSDKELDKYYSKGSYWKKQKIELLTARKYPVAYALAVSRWKLLEPLISDTVKMVSILDIGAGHGFYGMVAAKSKKVQLGNYTCVEKDKSLVASLKKTWTKYFNPSTLETTGHIDEVEGKFDVVVLSHVLEHQPEPKAFLQKVLLKLKKGGFVFIDVPHRDYLFKQDVFPHLIFFNIYSLQLLLQNCGLTTEFIACYGNDMNTSILNYRTAAKWYGLLARLLIKSKPLLPASSVLKIFTKYFGMDTQNSNGIWIRAIGQLGTYAK